MAKFIVTVVKKIVGTVEIEANTAVQARYLAYAQDEAGRMKIQKPKRQLMIRHVEKKRV